MKKIFSIMLAGVVAFSFVGCGSKAETTDKSQTGEEVSKDNDKATAEEEVTLTAWCWDPSFNGAALQQAEAIYQKENPNVKLEIVDMGKIDLEQKLNTNLASGVTKGLPDIILVNDSNIQKFVKSYPGAFADFTGKLDVSQFSQYKTDILLVEDQLYGVPFDIGVTGMFYRRDYLEQAGFTPEDLENITWDEYIEIGKVIKEKLGIHMMTINPNEEALTSVMLQSAGSWYITPDNEGDFVGNPAMTETIRLYKAFVDSGISKPVTGWSEFVGSFNAGEVATVVSGVWQIASIMDEASQSGQWGVAPTPRLDIDGGVNASNEGGSSWFVMESSENKDAAIDFLVSTIGGSSEFYEGFLETNGGVGSYIPAFDTPAYAKEDDFFGGQKIYEDFANWSTQVPGITLGMYTQEAKDALKNELPGIIQGADIDASLEAAQKLFEQLVQ